MKKIFWIILIGLFALEVGIFIAKYRKNTVGANQPVVPQISQKATKEEDSLPADFKGEKGQKIVFQDGKAMIDAAQFDDHQMRFFNTEIGGKTIYFFVVQDKNGINRAAANACQVCFGVRKGFRQEGDQVVCNNCGNRYPLEKIATEKGGCNPGPINPDLKKENGKIIIE